MDDLMEFRVQGWEFGVQSLEFGVESNPTIFAGLL